MGLTRVSGDIIQSTINVGVVTATGVNVGTAVTIHTGGFRVGSSDLHSSGLTVQNLNSTGVSTFTTLKVGTGVTISAGVITATSFKGDGSQLTGITQTTINNNANNRIITGSATANTLEAESNLTYDGTTLAVGAGGSITVGQSFIKPTSIGIGTTTTAGRNAGVGTAIGTLIYNSTTKQLEVYSGPDGWVVGASVPFTATSPTVTADTSSRPGWAVFTFTSPGSLVVSNGSKDAEYLVVAGGGGGGGGGANAGGGGAGGYRLGASTGTSGRGASAESLLPLTPGTYTIEVGGGGSAGPTSAPKNGGQGTPSSIANPNITTITSIGGGFGGGYPANGGPGGCGGGGSQNSPTQDRGAGTPGQGYDGGLDTTVSGSESGGGGGGAGGQGQDTIAPYTGAGGGGGAGGIGVESSITGSPVKRGGGGTGGSHSPPGAGPNPVPGGPWGGGDGAWGTTPATNGVANRGGGGGGGGDGPRAGGAGGSGIVIIAYPTA